MIYLLDTSVLASDRVREGDEEPAVSVISIGELQAGVLLASELRERTSRLQRLSRVLSSTTVLAVDDAVAAAYGELRAATGRQPSNDLWIAATALAHGYTLMTADHRQAALPLVETELL